MSAMLSSNATLSSDATHNGFSQSIDRCTLRQCEVILMPGVHMANDCINDNHPCYRPVDLANTRPRLSGWARRYCPWLVAGLLLVTSVLWFVMIHTVYVWIQAMDSIQIGNLVSALYSFTVTATTLGLNDLVLSPDWPLLSAFEATVGLILLGASTAFLHSVMGHPFKQMEEE